MEILKKIIKRIVFIISITLAGGVIGAILGVLATLGITFWAIANSNGDPSAGSVSIISTFLIPGGVNVGLVAGFAFSLLYPLVRSKHKRLINPRTGEISKRKIPK